MGIILLSVMKVSICVQLLCALSVQGYVLQRAQTLLAKSNNEDANGFLATEEEAWEFLGIKRCDTGPGLQCFFHGSDSSQCFDGIDAVCDGIVDCRCREDEELCLTDETKTVCAWKDMITSLRVQGIPHFGYGNLDNLAFEMFWMAGLDQFCPPDEEGISKLRCHSDPKVCFSLDELCDGAPQCDRVCNRLFGTDQACASDEDKQTCNMKDTFEYFMTDEFLKMRRPQKVPEKHKKNHDAMSTTIAPSPVRILSPSTIASPTERTIFYEQVSDVDGAKTVMSSSREA